MRAARTTRTVAKGAPYHTVCVLDGEEFTTQAAEDRHLTATGHLRLRPGAGMTRVAPSDWRVVVDTAAPGYQLVLDADEILWAESEARRKASRVANRKGTS